MGNVEIENEVEFKGCVEWRDEAKQLMHLTMLRRYAGAEI